MDSKRETLIITLLTVAAVALAFFSGFMVRDLYTPPDADYPILSQAQRVLRDHTISELPEARQQEYGMIRGMIQTLNDPFTAFNEPVQHELQTDSLEGRFGGIGVRLVLDVDGITLLYPIPESPAAEAGILDGDRLVSVDGEAQPAGTPQDNIRAALRGREGTEVTVVVIRGESPDELTFLIEREVVQLPSVTWHIAPDEGRIGIVEVNIIAGPTPEEIENAFADLAEQGATHFVLDLRDNGGGLLDAGIDAARLFLSDGIVMQQQYRDQDVETFSVRRPGSLAEQPLLLWVNHGTASASEIIAASLQAQGRVQLIGSPTFGKDVIQLVFELDDGSSIQVAAARWWVPDFVFPNGDAGVVPDFPLDPFAADSLDYLQKTIEIFFGES